MTEFFRPMVIELIQSINSTNIKIRKSSEEGFEMIASMLSEHNAIPQLLQMMLVGLAGRTPQVQSCSIRALLFCLKKTLCIKQELAKDGEEEKKFPIKRMVSSEEQVQDFLRKVTRIIALFLKD